MDYKYKSNTYWKMYKSFSINGGEPTPMKKWYIEHEDGTYTHISAYGFGDDHEGGCVSRNRTNPIKDPKTEILKEVTKEEVLRGLKIALKALDLPQEINILKHKFNYAEE